MKPKDLCIALAEAISDEAVVSILKEAGYWDNPATWRTFNDDESNYSTIGNQSSEPDAALVEKLVNSVDAMLMGACVEQEDDHKSADLPQSMERAVEKYFNVRHGRLAHMSPTERSRLAENIYLVS